MFAHDRNDQTRSTPFEVASTKDVRQSMNLAVEKLTHEQIERLEQIVSDTAKDVAGKATSSNLKSWMKA